jgi:hypothetical protein
MTSQRLSGSIERSAENSPAISIEPDPTRLGRRLGRRSQSDALYPERAAPTRTPGDRTASETLPSHPRLVGAPCASRSVVIVRDAQVPLNVNPSVTLPSVRCHQAASSPGGILHGARTCCFTALWLTPPGAAIRARLSLVRSPSRRGMTPHTSPTRESHETSRPYFVQFNLRPGQKNRHAPCRTKFDRGCA